MGRVAARYVVEGANGPAPDAARIMMHDNGTVVIPDFIANAGGIIAAFVELTSEVLPEENARTRENVTRAREMTVERISANVKRVLDLAADVGVPPLLAGRYVALSRIFEGEGEKAKQKRLS